MNIDQRERLIIRQSALKAAVEFVCAVVNSGRKVEDATDAVLGVAEKFEEWVTRDVSLKLDDKPFGGGK